MKKAVLFFMFLAFTATVSAHGGRLNSEGCHNDNTNRTYHCHDSEGNIISSKSIDNTKQDTATEENERANHNTTRSNQASGIRGDGGNDCDDSNSEIHPERCVGHLDDDDDNDTIPTRVERGNSVEALNLRERKLELRTEDTLWCWGRAGGRECSREVREERREILKERLQIEQRQYQRLQRQFTSRVEKLFERLSEEEYDRLADRLAGLIEQHQESGNARLLTAILVLQELLESSMSKKGYDYYQNSSDL